jgi:hypothetical protein
MSSSLYAIVPQWGILKMTIKWGYDGDAIGHSQHYGVGLFGNVGSTPVL